tara:strand:+ start:903 stop:1370 length:468 start_codon:yes stop_codon:yes gene_type:complete
MDDFKDDISKEVLDSLTMEDLWNSPRLKKLVEEKYPRAYLSITEPMREFGLFDFIKLAEAQIKYIKEATDLGSRDNFPKRDVMYAVKVIKENAIKGDKELWLGGVPFKFETSRFVKHYANEKTYSEWRAILKDIGTTKPNIDRILERYKSKFKEK